MKVNYERGTGFLVTLRGGGFARGVVARLNGKGLAYGYFFAPALSSASEASLTDLRPEDAVFVGKFGDLGLVKKEWPILGKVPGWNAERWPMPPLVRRDDETLQATLSHYDENTFRCLREETLPASAATKYPEDGTMGSGAVEILLTKLLGSDGVSDKH